MIWDYESGSLVKSFEGKKQEIIVKENDIKTFLSLGLHYDQLYKTGVLLNYNHKKIAVRIENKDVSVVISSRIESVDNLSGIRI